MRNLWPRSPEIIRDRLGVNEDAKQLRSGLLEADFQFGLDIMHARELHSVWQGAVAGEIEAITDAADFYVVHVDDFREAGGDGFELLFQRGVSNLFLTRLNGRGFALNVVKMLSTSGTSTRIPTQVASRDHALPSARSFH